MSRNPSMSQALAMKAAAAIAAQDEAEEQGPPIEKVEPPQTRPAPPTAAVELPPVAKRGRGRPKNKRAVEARHTVYLDAPRYNAITRLAEDRGRSVHSLILEGIDYVIGKPQNPGWQGK